MSHAPKKPRCSVGLVFAWTLGCSGSITSSPSDDLASPRTPGGGTASDSLDGKTPDQVLATCSMPKPGRAPMRRLSNEEYRNTVSDLFATVPGVVAKVVPGTQDFPSEPESLGFRNSADFLVVQSLAAQKYLDAAEPLAEAAAQSPTFVSCGTMAPTACAADFIRSFGKRAYRRPLTSEETARYEAVYQKAVSAGYDFKTGIEWIVFGMLQSPQFLYRVEGGGAPAGGISRPTPFEMASRLSYLYWQSMPDDALFAAAAAGQLDTPKQVEAQARRLLKDPKAARALEYFDQWLDLDVVQEMVRDPKVFPNLDAQLPALLQQETHAFVSSLMADPAGSFEQLLTAPHTFANKNLATHYRASGPAGAMFEPVTLPGRSGLLTQGMLLAHDKPTRTSIVRRGLKIRLDFLCQEVPAPPPDVNINLEALGANLTQRQRLEEHRKQDACAGCHTLMDPIGVVFEGFDAVGRARTKDETGAPVEIATQLGATDADGPVANPVELGRRLAASDQVRDCYVTQSFRFFYGRGIETGDGCTMARLLKDFRRTSFSLSELLVSLSQTDDFLYLPATEVSP